MVCPRLKTRWRQKLIKDEDALTKISDEESEYSTVLSIEERRYDLSFVHIEPPKNKLLRLPPVKYADHPFRRTRTPTRDDQGLDKEKNSTELENSITAQPWNPLCFAQELSIEIEQCLDQVHLLGEPFLKSPIPLSPISECREVFELYDVASVLNEWKPYRTSQVPQPAVMEERNNEGKEDDSRPIVVKNAPEAYNFDFLQSTVKGLSLIPSLAPVRQGDDPVLIFEAKTPTSQKLGKALNRSSMQKRIRNTTTTTDAQTAATATDAAGTAFPTTVQKQCLPGEATVAQEDCTPRAGNRRSPLQAPSGSFDAPVQSRNSEMDATTRTAQHQAEAETVSSSSFDTIHPGFNQYNGKPRWKRAMGYQPMWPPFFEHGDTSTVPPMASCQGYHRRAAPYSSFFCDDTNDFIDHTSRPADGQPVPRPFFDNFELFGGDTEPRPRSEQELRSAQKIQRHSSGQLDPPGNYSHNETTTPRARKMIPASPGNYSHSETTTPGSSTFRSLGRTAATVPAENDSHAASAKGVFKQARPPAVKTATTPSGPSPLPPPSLIPAELRHQDSMPDFVDYRFLPKPLVANDDTFCGQVLDVVPSFDQNSYQYEQVPAWMWNQHHQYAPLSHGGYGPSRVWTNRMGQREYMARIALQRQQQARAYYTRLPAEAIIDAEGIPWIPVCAHPNNDNIGRAYHTHPSRQNFDSSVSRDAPSRPDSSSWHHRFPVECNPQFVPHRCHSNSDGHPDSNTLHPHSRPVKQRQRRTHERKPRRPLSVLEPVPECISATDDSDRSSLLNEHSMYSSDS